MFEKYRPIGLIRCVDNLGRLVIPAEYRAFLEIDNADIFIFTEGNTIILSKLILSDFKELIALRQLDCLGRIVIPVALRHQLDIKNNTAMEIQLWNGSFLEIKKADAIFSSVSLK